VASLTRRQTLEGLAAREASKAAGVPPLPGEDLVVPRPAPEPPTAVPPLCGPAENLHSQPLTVFFPNSASLRVFSFLVPQAAPVWCLVFKLNPPTYVNRISEECRVSPQATPFLLESTESGLQSLLSRYVSLKSRVPGITNMSRVS
jgi:hypothetical protein